MQIKRRRNKTSKFIPNLHKILNEKDSGASWREDGKSFVLNNISKLISNSLPKYFRHSNISSFIRQLNLYGFKKLVGEDIDENTYYHEKFKKNYITQLKPIRSFYNQQKYGRLKKGKISPTEHSQLQSIPPNQEIDCINKPSGFPVSHSQVQCKQKIETLERQNERLRAIEQQHIYLLNLMNSRPEVFPFINFNNSVSANNYFNMNSTSKGPSTNHLDSVVNYRNNYQNFTENPGFNIGNCLNAYYIPYSNI